MKNISPQRQPLLIIFFTLVIALSFSLLPQGMKIGNYELKHVDMLIDVKPYEEIPVSGLFNNMPSVNASVAGPEELSRLLNTLFGSEANAPIQNAGSYLFGDTKQLAYFLDALKGARGQAIRIAHYGDSAIEGDLISADLREGLQSKFGGSALGHLGIVSQDITFRTTIKHSFSPEKTWETASIYSSNLKGFPLGISGEVVIPKGGSWVRYETTRAQKSLREFNTVRLFYTNAKNSSIKVYFNDASAPKSFNLTSGAGVKELVIKSDAPAKSVKLEFPDKDQAYLFGISLENGPGVYVDNFPLRGNSGIDIQKIPAATLKEYTKYFDYKLFILEFGLNLVGQQNYDFYEREMGKVINLIRSAYPKASILLISVHDKSIKQGSNFITDPSVLKLLQTQKNIASKNNVALFNLFEAMGGQNSMPKWVKGNPPLASADYIHFNILGAKKVSDLLIKSLIK